MRLALTASTLFLLLSAAIAEATPIEQAEIVTWGDSLTLGEGARPGEGYPEQLSKLLGRPVFNGGTPDESSTQIAARAAKHPNDGKIVVIWAGRNDLGPPDEAGRSIAQMVSRLTAGQHYLVLGLPNSSLEPRGSPLYGQVIDQNAYLAATYGENYIAAREALNAAGNPADAKDAADAAKDLPPTSLRSDYLHPNAAGYAVIAKTVAGAIIRHGW